MPIYLVIHLQSALKLSMLPCDHLHLAFDLLDQGYRVILVTVLVVLLRSRLALFFFYEVPRPR